MCAQGKSNSGPGDGKDKNPEAWLVAGTRGRNPTAARAGEEWQEVRAEGWTTGDLTARFPAHPLCRLTASAHACLPPWPRAACVCTRVAHGP